MTPDAPGPSPDSQTLPPVARGLFDRDPILPSIADSNLYRILRSLIRGREKSVAELPRATGRKPSLPDKNLAVLRSDGFVVSRTDSKDKRGELYALAPPYRPADPARRDAGKRIGPPRSKPGGPSRAWSQR